MAFPVCLGLDSSCGLALRNIKQVNFLKDIVMNQWGDILMIFDKGKTMPI